MKLSHEKIVQQAARAGRRTLQLGEEAGGRIRRLSEGFGGGCAPNP